MRSASVQGLRVILLASLALAATASAQVKEIAPGSEKPLFGTNPANLHAPKKGIKGASSPLPTWNGSFTFGGTTYTYNMVGKPPSTSASTTVPVEIIPIKIVITKSNGGVKTALDPAHVLSNGNTVTANTVASPMFQPIAFTSGGVSMGTTQYLDAYQRANFWSTVENHTGYHLLLGGPTVLPEQTLSPPAIDGIIGNVFGFNAGLVDINWFDAQVQAMISSLAIPANTLPIFLTYDVYLTDGGLCCYGGYHGVTATDIPVAYAWANYVDHVGVFSQDVSGVSHEVGEWATDPLVVNVNGNNTPCGPLENGDPLENDANFGTFPYQGSNGFTYHLQDLVTLPYFGAPPSTSVNGEFTFQGEALTVCENGF